jgi:hypothetical protein
MLILDRFHPKTTLKEIKASFRKIQVVSQLKTSNKERNKLINLFSKLNRHSQLRKN